MIGLKLAQIHLGKGTTGMLQLIKCFWAQEPPNNQNKIAIYFYSLGFLEG